jgi:hypothetical protein
MAELALFSANLESDITTSRRNVVSCNISDHCSSISLQLGQLVPIVVLGIDALTAGLLSKQEFSFVICLRFFDRSIREIFVISADSICPRHGTHCSKSGHRPRLGNH